MSPNPIADARHALACANQELAQSYRDQRSATERLIAAQRDTDNALMRIASAKRKLEELGVKT